MLPEETIILNKIQKFLKESYQNIGDTMIAGGVDNMEKYKYMMGQAHAYLRISQEISNLLNPKEPKNETEKDQKTSSTSDDQKTKPALLNKYEEDHQKEVDGYERLKTKESNKLPKPTGWRMVSIYHLKCQKKLKVDYFLDKIHLKDNK